MFLRCVQYMFPYMHMVMLHVICVVIHCNLFVVCFVHFGLDIFASVDARVFAYVCV